MQNPKITLDEEKVIVYSITIISVFFIAFSSIVLLGVKF
jgi:hypothetical protein